MTREHKKLLRLWATGKATAKQIKRCMELDRKEAVRFTPVEMAERFNWYKAQA